MFNKPKLLKFLNNNFTEHNYNNLEKAKKNYVDLVQESLQNKIFHDKIYEIMEEIEDSKYSNFFYNNLRMTCIEIE